MLTKVNSMKLNRHKPKNFSSLLLRWMMSLQRALTLECAPDSVFVKEIRAMIITKNTKRFQNQNMINMVDNGAKLPKIKQKRKECISLWMKRSLNMQVIQ